MSRICARSMVSIRNSTLIAGGAINFHCTNGPGSFVNGSSIVIPMWLVWPTIAPVICEISIRVHINLPDYRLIGNSMAKNSVPFHWNWNIPSHCRHSAMYWSNWSINDFDVIFIMVVEW